jgi:hypothetical protein
MNLITPKQVWQFWYLPASIQHPNSKLTLNAFELTTQRPDFDWFCSPSRITVAQGWRHFTRVSELLGLLSAKNIIRRELRGHEIRKLIDYFGDEAFDNLVLPDTELDDIATNQIQIQRRFEIQSSPSADTSVYGKFGILMFASLDWPASVKKRLAIMVPSQWLESIPKPIRIRESDLDLILEIVTPLVPNRDAY